MQRGNFINSLKQEESEKPDFSMIGPGASSGPFLLTSGYAAANDSANRGYLYWPSTRGRVELNSLSIAEIQRRVRYLCANFGFARRVVLGLAKMVGVLTPYPNTGNDEWDDLVFRNIEEKLGSEDLFDASGKFDFWGAQFQLDVDRWRDGDALIVPTDPGDYPGVQFMFYEGPQIRDQGGWRGSHHAYSQTARPEFYAGVKTDLLDRHLAYMIQDGINPEKYIEIPRSNAYYYANLESHRAIRGVSILAHAVTNMIDVIETRSFTKKRLKEAAATGRVIEQDNKFAFVNGAGGFGGPMMSTVETLPDGTRQEINWEVVLSGGAAPRLDPGERVKIVADDRPGPNGQEFEKALLHDVVDGTGLPYQALCDMNEIRGPGIRYTMAEIRRWVGQHLRYKAKYVRWTCALHVSNEIEAGRLPRPRHNAKDPYWWRRFEYIGEADMTIDEGRMGNLCLVNLESGVTTWGELWGGKGKFWKRAIDQRIAEVSYAKKKCAEEKLELREVFPRLTNAEPLAPAGDNPRAA